MLTFYKVSDDSVNIITSCGTKTGSLLKNNVTGKYILYPILPLEALELKIIYQYLYRLNTVKRPRRTKVIKNGKTYYKENTSK